MRWEGEKDGRLVRLEGGEGGRVVSWQGGKVVRWERWDNGEADRWEVPGFIQGWETKDEFKISSFCYRC